LPGYVQFGDDFTVSAITFNFSGTEDSVFPDVRICQRAFHM
jgi:hypothetical protein